VSKKKERNKIKIVIKKSF